MKSGKWLPKLKPKTFIDKSRYRNQKPKFGGAANKIETKNQNLKEPLLQLKPKTDIRKSRIPKPKPKPLFLFGSDPYLIFLNLIPELRFSSLNVSIIPTNLKIS